MKHLIKITKQEKIHFNIALEAITIINAQGFNVALIGGSVRDLLRRKFNNEQVIINDLDFCIFDNKGNSIGHQEMQKLVDLIHSNGFDIDPAGMKFLHFAAMKNGFEIEFGTPRAESYVDDSRKPICIAGNFKDDQKRRDFTINAIFAKIILNKDILTLDIIAGKNGINDIKKGVLRTVNSNVEKVFDEDPVRILRAIRFSKYGFKLDSKIVDVIFNFDEEKFKKVSSERIFDELKKILMKGDVEFLFTSGIIEKIIPEFKAFNGKIFEVETAKHIIKTINIADTIEMKLIALFHDIGKAHTGIFNETQNRWQFLKHEQISEILSKDILKRFGVDNKLINLVSGVCANHMRVKFLVNSKRSKIIKLLLINEFILPSLKFNKFDWEGKSDEWQEKMDTFNTHIKLENKINLIKTLIEENLTKETSKELTKQVCDNENIPIDKRSEMILSNKINFLSKIKID